MDSILKVAAEPFPGYGIGADILSELFADPRSDRPPTRHKYVKVKIVDDGHAKGLGNPQILRAIFKHLSLIDLVNLRRVNLRWNFIACEYLRERLGPCIVRPSKMKNFTKLMKRSCCNPFSNYAIRVENVQDSVFMKFLSDFAVDVVSLRMRLIGNEMPALLALLHKLPNLSHLHVIRLPEESTYLTRAYNSDDFWQYKYQHLLNLRSIKFEKYKAAVPFAKDYDSFIVNIINSSPNLSEVHFVDWGTTLSNIFASCGIINPKLFNGWNPNILSDDLNQLFQSGLNFRSIKLVINENKNVPNEWLEGQTTLKCLSIKYCNDTQVSSSPTFCLLSNVVTLYLHRWKGPVDDFPSLRQTFPKLYTLSLSSTTLEDLASLSNNNVNQIHECLTLKVLILMPLERCVDKLALLKLATLFPKVTQLFVQLNGNDSAHVIYQEWPNLQVVFLDFKENTTDEAITGIPNDDFEVTKELDCGCVQIKHFNNATRPYSIANLKQLLILVIRCGEGLTSLSLLKGISSLKQLQRLWLLPNPGEDCHYKWCVKTIADEFINLEHLVLEKEAKYSKDNIEYLMSRLPFIHLQFK